MGVWLLAPVGGAVAQQGDASSAAEPSDGTVTSPWTFEAIRVRLSLDKAVKASAAELVTFSVPFGPGRLQDPDSVAVRRDGTELSVHVEEGLRWHGNRAGIRSLIVQIPDVDMRAGDVVITVEGNRLDDDASAVPRAMKRPLEAGYATAGVKKAALPYPRVFALMEPRYLASTELIPPYLPGRRGDDFDRFAESQFDAGAGTAFDYAHSGVADWLFDRATAHYKRYLDTGEQQYLKEAFLAFRFYIRQIKQTGSTGKDCATEGRGGWNGIDREDSCNDMKYTYVEPIKLHYALTGDDTWFSGTDSVADQVEAMSRQTVDGNEWWTGYDCSHPPTSENYNFTERKCGLELLDHVNACSMYGAASACLRAERTIAFLKDLQQNPKPFDVEHGWLPLPGFFRHSWYKHECAECKDWADAIGEGNANDRRFSPWMTENVADALWQAYWQLDSKLIRNHEDIGEILRRLAVALDAYGFTSSPKGAAVPNHGLERARDSQRWKLDCNRGDLPLYSSSDIATQTALVETQNSEGWWSDMHVPELMTVLAAGRYFEPDSASRLNLDKRLESIEKNFIATCRDEPRFATTPRSWNWMMRSNGQRTWDWVKAQPPGQLRK